MIVCQPSPFFSTNHQKRPTPHDDDGASRLLRDHAPGRTSSRRRTRRSERGCLFKFNWNDFKHPDQIRQNSRCNDPKNSMGIHIRIYVAISNLNVLVPLMRIVAFMSHYSCNCVVSCTTWIQFGCLESTDTSPSLCSGFRWVGGSRRPPPKFS